MTAGITVTGGVIGTSQDPWGDQQVRQALASIRQAGGISS